MFLVSQSFHKFPHVGVGHHVEGQTEHVSGRARKDISIALPHVVVAGGSAKDTRVLGSLGSNPVPLSTSQAEPGKVAATSPAQ